MPYTIIFEKGPTSWGAYAPDLPGCGVAAETKEEAEKLIKEAITFLIEGLQKSGESPPEPAYFAQVISIG